jgi:hypothetical protein
MEKKKVNKQSEIDKYRVTVRMFEIFSLFNKANIPSDLATYECLVALIKSIERVSNLSEGDIIDIALRAEDRVDKLSQSHDLDEIKKLRNL